MKTKRKMAKGFTRHFNFTAVLCMTFSVLTFAHGIHDPLYSGIKTRTYQRDPLIAKAFEQQQQHNANSRLSATKSNYGGATQTQQQVAPIYDRPVVGQQIASTWHNAENAITEYYTGCPTGHTGPLPYEYDCRRFLNCFKGRGHIQSCGPGTVFNPQTLECDRPDKVLCGAAAGLGIQQQTQQQQRIKQTERTGRLLDVDIHCPAGATGLQPHPGDCTKFLNCANDQTYVHDCSPGTAFSETLLSCDYKHKVDCGERQLVAASVTPIIVNAANTGSSQINGISCPAGITGLYAHPYDKRKYLNCAHGNNAAPLIEECDAGLSFDSVHLVCSETDKVVDVYNTYAQNNQNLNNSTRHVTDILCPDSVLGLFAHPFDQTKFINCRAGKIAIESCIADFVFSISHGSCMEKSKLAHNDYVQYIVSEVSHEYSLMLTNCPPGTDGLHLYPYDGIKYLRCFHSVMSIESCPQDLAFSISQKACRPIKFLTADNHVKFHWELEYVKNAKQVLSYSDTQAFQSKLNQCPPGMNGLYPYPFHSAKYILCQNGLLQIESCSSGKVFSLSKKQCWIRSELLDGDYITFQIVDGDYVHDASNFVQDLTTITCPANANGYFLHPFDCTKYLICYNQQTSIESCGAGHVFSISKRHCIRNDQVESYDRVEYLTETQNEFFETDNKKTQVTVPLPSRTDVSCPIGATGMYPHPSDCTKFLNCDNGRTLVQSCGPGTSWNPQMEVCDFAQRVNCSPTSGLNAINTKHTVNNVVPNEKIRCPANVYGLYAHPFDNTKFLRCENGYTNVQSCCEGNVFSISRSYCLPNQEVSLKDRVHFLNNPHNSHKISLQFDYIFCPEGFDGVYIYPFDCTKYIDCNEGQTVLKDCPDNTHFSISHGACLSAAEIERADRVYSFDELQTFYNWQQNYRSQLSNKNAVIVCPQGLLGLYQHPYDASQFLNCQPGKVIVRECPENTVFSLSRRLCLSLDEVSVNDRSDYVADASVDFTAQQHAERTGKSFEVVCPPDASGIQPHPYDCSKFLNCANGATYIQECAPGTAWNMQLEVCDYIVNVDCTGRNAATHITASNINREAKAYSSDDNAGIYGHNQQKGSPTYRDRWSNMNMQRPTASSTTYAGSHRNNLNATPSSTSTTWSGYGISEDRVSPSESVLYVQGSLVPNRNYQQNYETPLAPFKPLTTVQPIYEKNLYFAQPVTSEEDSDVQKPKVLQTWQPSDNRQNFSRKINHISTSIANWQPLPHYGFPVSTSETSTVPLPNTQLMPPPSYTDDHGQTPLSLDNEHVINVDQLPTDRVYILTDQFSSGSQPISSSLPDASNLYGGLQPPSLTQPNPTVTNSHPSQRPTYSIDKTNLYGGLQPPKVSFSITTTTPSATSPKRPDYPHLNHRPTYAIDETNLYGGLQPPKVSLATPTPNSVLYTTPSPVLITPPPVSPHSQIYPALMNATVSQAAHPPHYSPSYSGVSRAHIDGGRGKKIPQPTLNTQIEDRQKPLDDDDDFQDQFNTQFEYDDLEKGIKGFHDATTERRSFLPPPYNRVFYSTTKVPRTVEKPETIAEVSSQLPISEALRVLLKPYFNRSGTIDDTVALRAESHIMSLISGPKNNSIMTEMTATAFKPTVLKPRSTGKSEEPDAELIFTDEQENLVGKIIKTSTDNTHEVHSDYQLKSNKTVENTNNWHENRHDQNFYQQHLNHNTEHFEDKTAAQNQTHNHHQYQHQHQRHHNHHQQHSEAFHRRHPELPNPFESNNGHTPRHQHSYVFHQKHPELPNPFTNTKIPKVNAETTTSSIAEGIDLRGNFDQTACEFDCGNGKCIKQLEVCDGFNNCGNRWDESKCEHLGYEVRLTGGESTNMGRIEVKILGKWGYVCDDKFGLRDADVICKELGFNLGANEVRGNSYYPPTEINFSYAMDEVECLGNETKLKDCPFKGWGINNCGPDEVVGVVCKVPLLKCPNNYWLCSTSRECIPPAFLCDHTEDCADKSDESDAVCNSPVQYRLEGGRSPIEGRLEVKYRGEWGTVCDDDFSLKEAQVACNSLGYYGRAKIEKNIYGLSSGPIWLDQVSCFGNESTIDKCNHWTWGEHNCNHTEDVALRCTAGPPPRRSTSLQNVNDTDNYDLQQTQTTFEDIGLYAGQWERSSKFLNNQRRCGHFKDDLHDEYAHPEQRVINGTVAKRGRHPWQATIRTRGRAGISSHWCGAVLISKRHLLTAAHCLAGYPKGAYFVRLGDHYANIAESSEIDSYIENWYIHEKFRDKSHMNNDIALIVLKMPVRFSDYVQPVCLPEKGVALVENRMCTISGWGSIKSGVSTPSNILRAAQLPILHDDVCKQSHVYGSSITEGMFCAGSMDESVDACDGDSGGPLVCADDDGETLYGIISWGQHCGYINKPGVYVRVEKYIDWIYEKINFSMQQI